MKKLFAVLQANLGAIGYRLEESDFDLVAIQLRTRTTNFLKQMKAERNGKRRSRKKAETWRGLSLYPKEISKTPHDIVTQMKKTEIELRRTNDDLQSTIEDQAACLFEQMMEEQAGHKGRPFNDVGQRQRRRHISKIR